MKNIFFTNNTQSTHISHTAIREIRNWFIITLCITITLIIGITIDVVRGLPTYYHIQTLHTQQMQLEKTLQESAHTYRTLTEQLAQLQKSRDERVTSAQRPTQLHTLCSELLANAQLQIQNLTIRDHECNITGNTVTFADIQQFLHTLHQQESLTQVELISAQQHGSEYHCMIHARLV